MSIESCTAEVCAASQDLVEQINGVSAEMDSLQTSLRTVSNSVDASGAALQCVINGAVDQSCNLPLGGTLPTLADALDKLNATAIGDLDVDLFEATQDQAIFTMSRSVSNLSYLEVSHNGALLTGLSDYDAVGTSLTLGFPADAGDSVMARHFVLS